ncbi:MFS transporter [Pseudomonas atacamensis]|uniref:MFS transporter n=1 Tax=Pseudomonas atacamensis TaxID=2565368 RepID=A0AAQ2D6F4_9PSED|nr:MFS transporter [Pseudomonas atacamensis]THF25807.1 MFS transporter [Pseudomonas atacamensis]
MSKKSMRRQVAILASAQALFQTISVMVMTIGGLAGSKITDSPGLATLPVGTMFLGTACMMFPASMLMARYGRRVGFIFGTFLGALGGLVAAFGIYNASLPELSLGTFLIGVYQAFAQFYRFAAGEVADDAFRARAISYVMAGGVIAAIGGPMLARLGGNIFDVEYMGAFLIITVISLLATGVLFGLRMPVPVASPTGIAGRPWQKIVIQPTYFVALFGGATGYGIMILAMTSTPLAMIQHHHALSDAATVIQLHVLGMFLPSFFTGFLITRLGALRIMLAGVAFLMAHILLTLTGTTFTSFASALVFLGIGWNFMYISGTTLLTSTYTPAEKARAQAINDMAIFVVGVTCSFGSGILLEKLGWITMNIMLIPWLVFALISILWLQHKNRERGSHSESIEQGQLGRLLPAHQVGEQA